MICLALSSGLVLSLSLELAGKVVTDRWCHGDSWNGLFVMREVANLAPDSTDLQSVL